MTDIKINKIMNYTKKCINITNNLTEYSYYKLLKETFDTVKEKYPETTLKMMTNIFSTIFDKQFMYNSKNTCVTEYLEHYPPIIIPDEYIQKEEHFQKLKALPQPEQRTKAWYEYRHNRITASDTAAAIDENPYEPVESFILKKSDPTFSFLDNANVYHGKKFELIATKIYEHIYNVQVFEFGALPSQTYELLGASPDGICSCKTLDNKFSTKLGTMLEIKCVAPFGRKIESCGDIKGTICPYYYYLQVQQQLECCELDVCDFWQCKLIEYKSREEYLVDLCNKTYHTVGTNGERIEIDNNIKKGVLLQFYPKDFKPEFPDDNIEWKSKFIYPPRLDITSIQHDEWIAKVMSTLNKEHKELVKDFYFHKIIYWKLEQSHNVAIERDRKLFLSLLPVLNESWQKVLYYREHQDELPKLREIVEQRKKFIRTNTDFAIDTEIIKNKILFLDNCDNKKSKKKTVSKEIINNPVDECDFIDDIIVETPVDKSTKVTEKPVKATVKPVKATVKPVKATEKSTKATEKQVKVTEKPVKVTEKPVKVTEKPVKVTDKTVKKVVKKPKQKEESDKEDDGTYKKDIDE
jgi:putative phage-type endonuclease